MMWEADEDRAGAGRAGPIYAVCVGGRVGSSSPAGCHPLASACRAGGARAVQDFVDLYFRVSTDVTGNEPRRLYNLLEFLLFSVRHNKRTKCPRAPPSILVGYVLSFEAVRLSARYRGVEFSLTCVGCFRHQPRPQPTACKQGHLNGHRPPHRDGRRAQEQQQLQPQQARNQRWQTG